MAELKTTETPVVEQAEYMAPRAASQAKWLTVEYALAMVSVTFAAITSIVLVPMLFGMWSAKEAMSFGLMLSGSITANILAVGILAVLFSVLAFVLFGYTGRLAYKLTTYGSLFMIVLAALPLVANLISVLISSLLLIGVSDAGSVYTALYLGNFLPSLVCLAVLAVVIFFIGKIINGYNKSRPLAITLIAITGVVAVALAITLAVQAHDKPSIKKSNFKYNSSYLLD